MKITIRLNYAGEIRELSFLTGGPVEFFDTIENRNYRVVRLENTDVSNLVLSNLLPYERHVDELNSVTILFNGKVYKEYNDIIGNIYRVSTDGVRDILETLSIDVALR